MKLFSNSWLCVWLEMASRNPMMMDFVTDARCLPRQLDLPVTILLSSSILDTIGKCVQERNQEEQRYVPGKKKNHILGGGVGKKQGHLHRWECMTVLSFSFIFFCLAVVFYSKRDELQIQIRFSAHCFTLLFTLVYDMLTLCTPVRQSVFNGACLVWPFDWLITQNM